MTMQGSLDSHGTPPLTDGAPRAAEPVHATDGAPLEPGAGALLDALLRSPARVLDAIRERPRTAATLWFLGALGLAGAGFAMATWSGGPQLALVPLKLALVALVSALVCLPSLHVLSALSGGTQPLRETSGALAMGVALTAVLAVALVPIAWVLSAATDSVALAGTLYLAIFVTAASFGLGLVRRALGSASSTGVRGLGAWSAMFVIVALQLATTLRPLVGPFDGIVLHERTFFLAHFVECLGGR